MSGIARVAAALLGALLPMAAALAQQQDLQLPAQDITAPKLVYEPSAEAATAGEPYVISVTATDETAVESVSLFYRRIGDSAFTRLEMDPIGGGMYTLSVPAEDMREPGIEYYVQAADQAGNTVLRGYSFQPLALEVVPAPAVAAPEAAPEPVAPEPEPQPTVAEADSGGVNWLWIVLGVGAAVALAGGGDGGGGGDSDTVTIGGPTPE